MSTTAYVKAAAMVWFSMFASILLEKTEKNIWYTKVLLLEQSALKETFLDCPNKTILRILSLYLKKNTLSF